MREPELPDSASHPDIIPAGSVHYALEWSSRLFGMTFRMILRPMKPCAPIKGIGWRKYNQYLIWKYISMPIYKVQTSRIPRPGNCCKHRDVSGELSHPHRDVATQTGDCIRCQTIA